MCVNKWGGGNNIKRFHSGVGSLFFYKEKETIGITFILSMYNKAKIF